MCASYSEQPHLQTFHTSGGASCRTDSDVPAG